LKTDYVRIPVRVVLHLLAGEFSAQWCYGIYRDLIHIQRPLRFAMADRFGTWAKLGSGHRPVGQPCVSSLRWMVICIYYGCLGIKFRLIPDPRSGSLYIQAWVIRTFTRCVNRDIVCLGHSDSNYLTSMSIYSEQSEFPHVARGWPCNLSEVVPSMIIRLIPLSIGASSLRLFRFCRYWHFIFLTV
jgi:hypothetical protein